MSITNGIEVELETFSRFPSPSPVCVVWFGVSNLGTVFYPKPVSIAIAVPDNGQSLDQSINQARSILADRVLNLHKLLVDDRVCID